MERLNWLRSLRNLSILCLWCFSNLSQAAVILVDSSGDVALPNVNGDCTLREAIQAAETNAAVDGCAEGDGPDTIEFGSSVQEIEITAGNLSDSDNPITESLTIKGPGVNLLDINGDDLFQLFSLDSTGNNQTFRFSGMRLVSGSASRGGAIAVRDGDKIFLEDVVFRRNIGSSGGGAIYLENASSGINLSVINCTFDRNEAQGAINGGAIRAGNNAIVDIQNSTFVGNIATVNGGGAISVFSNQNGPATKLTITRSTFSANRTNGGGGAVSISGIATIDISYSTFVDNIANEDQINSGISHRGGGIILGPSNTLTLTNSIFANQDLTSLGPNADDIVQLGAAMPEDTVPIISLGFNFIRSNSGSGSSFPSGFPNDNMDYVGTNANPIQPNLTPLQDNGGPTLTHRPMILSAPANAGSCSDQLSDQRGFGNPETRRRPVQHPEATNGPGSDGCDIGATESFAIAIEPEEPEESELCFVVKATNSNVIVSCL